MSEFLDIAQAASTALAQGETVCLATVVRVRGSAPRHTGARLLIWPDGKFHGTIGAGHVAQPLAQMGTLLDMRIVVVDDRAEWANRERFPTANEVLVVDYEPATEILAPLPVAMTPSTYVVVTTWGYDLPALEQALAQQPAYIGLVASPTKARELFKRLLAKGASAEALRRVSAPVGLDIGAESPAEVAFSILAEVLAMRRGRSGRFLREVRGEKLDALLNQIVRVSKPA